MINKQNLLAALAAVSISGTALYAAEEKEFAATQELGQTQELDQADQEDKRVDLYREGINAFTRCAMYEQESPIIQAFKKMHQDSQPGLFGLFVKWAFAAKPAAPSRQIYPYPTFNFDLFRRHPKAEVDFGTMFQITLDKDSKNKDGQPLLSVDPATWLNNPTINNGNVLITGLEYSGGSHDGNAPTFDTITLQCRAERKGISRFTLDNNGDGESHYWIDILVE